MLAKVMVWMGAFILIGTACLGEEWVAFSNPGNPPVAGDANEIVFNCEGTELSTTASEFSTVGGSSAMHYTLLTSGSWAVCGEVEADGRMVPDEYATFVPGGLGGHISWRSDTPAGYVASLLVGGSFIGDGAATYTGNWWGTELAPSTGTLVIQSIQSYYRTNKIYEPLDSHVFKIQYTAPVPEPSALFALLTGAIGLTGIAGRSRRRIR